MFSNTSLISRFSKLLFIVQFFVLISLTMHMKSDTLPYGSVSDFN